ncbi:MAG: YqgE/AlgH family protein [bacterium]
MNLDFDLFKIEKGFQIPKVGRVLISEPFLRDMYFKRTVILLTEHNEEGSVGFVLNKPLNVPFSEIVTDFPNFDMDISLGGPVSTNTLHYLHTFGELVPGSIKIIEGIYWGGDFDMIKSMIAEGQFDSSQIRFFLGYSGWQADQLEAELLENSWVVSEMDPQSIMTLGSENIWKNSLSKIGGKFKLWSNFPENPSLN